MGISVSFLVLHLLHICNVHYTGTTYKYDTWDWIVAYECGGNFTKVNVEYVSDTSVNKSSQFNVFSNLPVHHDSFTLNTNSISWYN